MKKLCNLLLFFQESSNKVHLVQSKLDEIKVFYKIPITLENINNINIKLCSCFDEFFIENQNLFIERFNSICKEILKQFDHYFKNSETMEYFKSCSNFYPLQEDYLQPANIALNGIPWYRNLNQQEKLLINDE